MKLLDAIVSLLMLLRPLWLVPLVLPAAAIARFLDKLHDRRRTRAAHQQRAAALAADVRRARANGAKRVECFFFEILFSFLF